MRSRLFNKDEGMVQLRRSLVEIMGNTPAIPHMHSIWPQVVSVDASGKKAHFGDGMSQAYDHLLIATGVR